MQRYMNVLTFWSICLSSKKEKRKEGIKKQKNIMCILVHNYAGKWNKCGKDRKRNFKAKIVLLKGSME